MGGPGSWDPVSPSPSFPLRLLGRHCGVCWGRETTRPTLQQMEVVLGIQLLLVVEQGQGCAKGVASMAK